MTGSVFTQSAKQQIKYAKKLVRQGNHYGASIYFKSALYLDSSNFDLIYSYAQSLRNYNNYNEAEYYYKKIRTYIKLIKSIYRQKNINFKITFGFKVFY